jgi:hypothetical protein
MNAGEQRRRWGRIGGLTAWSRNGADTMLSPALKGFAARFERQVDPAGILPPEERARRADRARRAWMLQLAAKSAEARREGKAASAGRSAETAMEIVDDADEPQQPA